MVHFAVAHRISNGAPTAELLIGSIAPDAIHARPGTTRQDKKATHLFHDGILPSREKIVQQCADALKSCESSEQRSFVMGYFAHIFTDLRWVETLYTDFKRVEGQICDGDKAHLHRVYAGETSQLEFELMRAEAWTPDVLRKLDQAAAFALEPYVTAEEVHLYRKAKLNWLLDAANEPRLPLRYFYNGSRKRLHRYGLQ
jgi:hypothetical protein